MNVVNRIVNRPRRARVLPTINEEVIEVVTPRVTNARTLRNRRRRQRRRANVGAQLAQLTTGMNGLRVKGPNQTRSGVVPNPADPRTDLTLAQLGNTVGGRMAALKILHPNGEGDEYVTKYPDGCANTSIVMERRDEFKLEPPPLAVDEQSNWNCILMDLPFLLQTQVAVRYAATMVPTPAQLNLAIEFALSSPGLPTVQWPAWGGFTQGSFNCQFTVLGASSLTPSYTNTLLGPATEIKSMRRTYLGSTVDLDASELYNQGRVVAGQWKPDITLAVANDFSTPPGVHNIYAMQTPAALISNIVNTDELCYQGQAKHGLYVPNRVGDIDPAMTACQEWRIVSPTVPTASSEQRLNNTSNTVRDLWLRGWLVGSSFWSDLDYRASLRVKRKEGLEFISAPSGPFAPFATEALPSDTRAQQMIQEFARTQPHAFPADFNELGTLLRNIVSGISGALSNLGLPVISGISGLVNSVSSGNVGKSIADVIDTFW